MEEESNFLCIGYKKRYQEFVDNITLKINKDERIASLRVSIKGERRDTETGLKRLEIDFEPVIGQEIYVITIMVKSTIPSAIVIKPIIAKAFKNLDLAEKEFAKIQENQGKSFLEKAEQFISVEIMQSVIQE